MNYDVNFVLETIANQVYGDIICSNIFISNILLKMGIETES